MKPIIFNQEMVEAILEGRKTQTRRPLKEPFEIHPNGWITKPKGNERLVPYEPPYQVGDVLYVRETFADIGSWDAGDGYKTHYLYKADFMDSGYVEYNGDTYEEDEVTYKPSIHMPKEAARIFLKVTDVRAEKLQDIDDDGVIAEGITEAMAYALNSWKPTFNDPDSGGYPDYTAAYEELWNSIYNNWNDNPYVWVISFERCDKP